MTKTLKCPACATVGPEPLFEIRNVSVRSHTLWPTAEAAKAVPRGDIALGLCLGCGLIYNYVFDPALVEYSKTYDATLEFSPYYQKYASETVARLTEKYGLRDKTIVEIGCGTGAFLAQLCAAGGNRGYGFDPGADAVPDRAEGSDCTIIAERYTSKHAGLGADFIVCRHVLEHLDDPRRFLEELRRTVSGGFAVYFEVPNSLDKMPDHGIWDVIYEHVSYFHDASLARLFRNAGFAVEAIYPAYERQFLCLEGKAAEGRVGEAPLSAGNDVAEARATARTVGAHYATKTAYWRGELERLFQARRNVVLWGAGAKATSFLGAVTGADRIQCVIDVNPRKQGNFMAGGGQPIVAPEALAKSGVDVVLITNPLYLEEIGDMLANLGLEAEVRPV